MYGDKISKFGAGSSLCDGYLELRTANWIVANRQSTLSVLNTNIPFSLSPLFEIFRRFRYIQRKVQLVLYELNQGKWFRQQLNHNAN